MWLSSSQDRKGETKVNEDIRKDPYGYITSWAESILPHTGKKIFEVLSLMPCSLILPDLKYEGMNIRSNINCLFLGTSGCGKTTITEMFKNFTYSPISVTSITAARLESEIKKYEDASLIIGDLARVSRDINVMKIIEGILGEEKCIFKDSLIAMANGTLKKIKDIKIGEDVLSFNKNLEIVNSKVISKVKKNFKNYLKIKTRTTNLLVSHKHKFFFLDGINFKKIESKNLKVGDFLPIPLKINEIKKDINLPSVDKFKILGITNKAKELIESTLKSKEMSKYELSRRLKKDVSYISSLIHSKHKPNKEFPIIKKLCEILEIKKYLEKEDYFPNYIHIPKKISIPFCEFLGMYWGDGNYYKKQRIMYISDKNLENINFYAKIIKNIFHTKIRIRKQENKHQLFIKNSKPLFYLLEKLGLKLTNNRNLPEIICKLDNVNLSGFLRGYFDAESSVRTSSTGGIISIETSCKEVIYQLKTLLLRFGILSSIYERNRYDERFVNKNYISYVINITDRDSMIKFKDSIGFNHPEKIKRLNYSILKFKNGHRRYYRYKPKIISDLMKLMNIKSNDIFKSTNIRTNEFFNEIYNIPLKTLKKIYQYLNMEFTKNNKKYLEVKKIKRNLNFLKLLIEKSDRFVFDEIIKIEKIEKDLEENFYDIVLNKNYNFIANGLFTHNSTSRMTMRSESMEEKNMIGLMCGIPHDLSAHFSSGNLFRTFPIILFHSQKQHSEIGDYINNKIGNENKEVKEEEEEIKNYYQELLKIQKESHQIHRIKGYIIPDEFKKTIYNRWNLLTKKIHEESNMNFFRELHEYYRIMISHSFLQIFNRKIEDNKLIVTKEDLDVALRLGAKNINIKKKIIKCDIFAKTMKDLASLKRAIESDKVDEETKNILQEGFLKK